MNFAKQLSPPKRVLLLVLTFAATIVSLLPTVTLSRHQNSSSPTSGDAILEYGRDFSPPVELTLFRSQERRIEPGRRFPAAEGWFKGLTTTVCNRSEVPISHLSLRLLFPRPSGQEDDLDFVEPLSYGESPIATEDGQILSNTAKAILPGGCVDLGLSGADYENVRAALKSLNYPPAVNKIKVSVSVIGFDDGSVWMGGKRYQVDRSRPGKLIPLEKKS